MLPKKLAAAIKWKPEYSVGIPHIDDEHKELIGLIQALETLHAAADHNTLERILATLSEYTKRHFLSEEVMMKEIGYPKLIEHRNQHRAFIHKVSDFEAKFRENKTLELSDEILHYLRTWLTTHILVHDKAYEAYRKAHNIRAPIF